MSEEKNNYTIKKEAIDLYQLGLVKPEFVQDAFDVPEEKRTSPALEN